MKAKRILPLFLALLLALSAAPAAFASLNAATGSIPTRNFSKTVDFIAQGDWSGSFAAGNPEGGMGLQCTPGNGGLDITVVGEENPHKYISVPMDATIDVEKSPYLGFKISGLPADAQWTWAVEFVDRNGLEGTVHGTRDYGLDGGTTNRAGNFDGQFNFLGSFNYRKNDLPEFAALDFVGVKITQVRVSCLLPTGASFRLDEFFIGDLKGPETIDPATPAITAAGLNYLELGEFIFTGEKEREDHVVSIANAGAGKVFTHAEGREFYWPSVQNSAESPAVIPRADFANYTFHYDFTVSAQTAISLYTIDIDSALSGGSVKNRDYLRFNDFIAPVGADTGENDLPAGIYAGRVNLKALLDELNYVGDDFKVYGMRIFVIGDVGEKVEIRALYLEGHASEPENPPGWARDAVDFAKDAGFLPPDLQRNYNTDISRLDFCRLTVAFIEYQTGMDIDEVLIKRNVIRPAAFDDSSHSDVLAAAALGIVNGVGGNLFNPNGNIDRQSAARMLSLACEALGADSSGAPANTFADDANINSWARPFVNYMLSVGVMTGATATEFRPRSGYTIATSIVTFYRVAQNITF